MKKHNIITLISVSALISGIAVYLGLTLFSPDSNASASPSTDRKIIYWKAPMDPTEIYDAPGKSKMGMDLVPVYEDEVNSAKNTEKERKIVYWKAPMDPTEIYDEPGKSKMGMDLVPVYEDELVGGVDISIDPVVEQNMGLKVAPVEKGQLNHTIETYGRIAFDESRTSIISQKADGWIEKLYADYTGFKVKKGAPLYAIYSPALLASQEEYLTASRHYKKNKSAVNKELLDSARRRLEYYDISSEDINQIEKRGHVQKTMIVRSPYQGVVVSKNITEGDYVKPGARLFTIADLSSVWVESHIFEYEQHLVREGQTAQMSLSYVPGEIYSGKIAYIFPYLQEKTRDVVVRMTFENPNGTLKPDMFARIKINAVPDAPGLSIPSQAIIHSGEENIVFVANGNGHFTPRRITTGLSLDQGRIQVLSGLARDENIVVSGQFLLDSESKLKEAIQKMIESKSKGPAVSGKPPADADETSDDDFFKNME
jgi:Cu(I)/Ag(I) efflux system membrane fusion protein/cobalt-zinc-cadmium efflux system membrane fusion protein